MKNIVLTGFMASGKTSAGKMVSQITGLEFFDMDEYIETKAGPTVSAGLETVAAH